MVNSEYAFEAHRKYKFSDPFLAPSSDSMPVNLESALDFALFLYHLNPQYLQASKRTVAHFVTDVDFDQQSGDQKERDEFYDYLKDGLDILGATLAMGDEWACFGNGFFRIHFPFDRYLIDRRGDRSREYSMDMFEDAKFHLSEMVYEVQDPTKMHLPAAQRSTVKLPFRDRKSTDPSRISLRKIDPRRVNLQHSWLSGRTRVIYRFEEWFRNEIKQGHLWQVNDTPICMLRAIAAGEDFLFNEGEVYHCKAPTISGISNHGWGIPPTILNFRSIRQLQVYHKLDEAVGKDYMLPFRFFTPNIGGTGDISQYAALGPWADFMEQVIKKRRTDPYAIHALPYSANYQEVGAEGKQLTPKDLIEYQTNDMLDGMGYPAQLFRASLTVEQIPTTIRLFENSFHFLYRHFDGFLRWVSSRVLDYLQREQLDVSLQLPSMADDIEERQIYLQLAAGGEISRAKAYRPFGINNPVAEAKERMHEDIEIQKEQAKVQAEFQREQQMGSADAIINAQMGQQGAAGSGPGGAPVTPLDVGDKATDQATKLLQMPVGDRRKVLDQLRNTDYHLYSLVKQKMEELRSQGESQGRAQAGQQPQPPSGAAGPQAPAPQ